MKRTTPETIQAQADSQAKRARAKGAKGRGVTALQWAAVLRAWVGCAYCDRTDQPLTMDHFVPLELGGLHEASNIVPACLSCNSSKGGREFEEWFAWKFGGAK